MSAAPTTSTDSRFGRRFWPLFGLGLVGVLALAPTLAPILAAKLQQMPKIPLSLNALVAASLIQPTLLLAAGAALGAGFADRVGFSSHLARVNVHASFAAEIPRAILIGALLGALLVVADLWAFPSARAETEAAGKSAGQVATLVGGMLYGGMTEEIMMRWGLVSVLAWLGHRFAGRGTRNPAPAVFWTAIVLAAIHFAAAHLPAAAASHPLTADIVARVLVLNAFAGLVYGWLFWRRSLESAMLAHAFTHVAFAVVALAR